MCCPSLGKNRGPPKGLRGWMLLNRPRAPWGYLVFWNGNGCLRESPRRPEKLTTIKGLQGWKLFNRTRVFWLYSVFLYQNGC